jgi:anaerobic magnesium-protoporphyrin IX monomethyl ester cyclase
MKFLFINPSRTIDTGNIWSTVNAITPPLGLATLAAILEGEGHQADIIDMAAMNLTVSDVLGAVGQSVDCIGITATTPEIKKAAEIAAAVRARFPRIKVVMGGVHPTVFHQELVANNDCDIVVRGEGEQTIRDIANETQLQDIPGITWRTANGEVIVNPSSDHYVDLNTLPFPAFAKLPMKRYRSALGAARRSPSIGVITSRGCPGTCTFCFSGMFGTRIRFMTAERVLELISYLKTTFGIREISFYDDTFTAHKPRVEELCNALIRERMNISWSCFARVDSVKPDLLKLMREAGCHQIMYGFESADDAILTGINKRVKSSSYETIVQWTRAANIDIRGAFMLGNPGETVENLKQTIDYSKKMGIQFAIYNITTPFPGTQLYKKMEEQGYLKHREWELYDLAHAAMDLPTVASQDVERYYSLAYRGFYFRPGYILKRIAAIRTVYQFTAYWKVFWGMLSMLFLRESKNKKKEKLGR